MTTKKAMRKGKILRWDLFLLLERHNSDMRQLFDKLKNSQFKATLGTFYNYKRRWEWADKKVKEMEKFL